MRSAITRLAAGIQGELPSQGITKPDAIRFRQVSWEKDILEEVKPVSKLAPQLV